MTEFLYADAHLAGNFVNPTNAVGNTPSTWAGVLNDNTNYTSRWSLANPSGALTGTQTIRIVARKGGNTANPTISINLYDNGTLVREILATTNVTSTTGQTLTATFASTEVSSGDNVEIQVVQTGQGGNQSTRNTAQISHIEFEADFILPATNGAASGSGVGLGASQGAEVLVVGAASGSGVGEGHADKAVITTGVAEGSGLGSGSASGEEPPPEWINLTHFAGITDTTYTDTVETNTWYRYAVAGTDSNDDPITLYTDWVQSRASEAFKGSGAGSGAALGQAIAFGSASGSAEGQGSIAGEVALVIGELLGSALGQGEVSGLAIGKGALHGTARGFGSATGFVALAVGSGEGSGVGSGAISAEVETYGSGAGSGAGSGSVAGSVFTYGHATGQGLGSGSISALVVFLAEFIGSGEGSGVVSGEVFAYGEGAGQGVGSGLLLAVAFTFGAAEASGEGSGSLVGSVILVVGQSQGSGVGSGAAAGRPGGALHGSGIGSGSGSGQIPFVVGSASGNGLGSGATSGVSIGEGALHGTARGFGSITGSVSLVVGSAGGSGTGSGTASGEVETYGSVFGSGSGNSFISGSVPLVVGPAAGAGAGQGNVFGVAIGKGALHGTARGFGSTTGSVPLVVGSTQGFGYGLGSTSGEVEAYGSGAGSGVGSGEASGAVIAIVVSAHEIFWYHQPHEIHYSEFADLADHHLEVDHHPLSTHALGAANVDLATTSILLLHLAVIPQGEGIDLDSHLIAISHEVLFHPGHDVVVGSGSYDDQYSEEYPAGPTGVVARGLVPDVEGAAVEVPVGEVTIAPLAPHIMSDRSGIASIHLYSNVGDEEGKDLTSATSSVYSNVGAEPNTRSPGTVSTYFNVTEKVQFDLTEIVVSHQPLNTAKRVDLGDHQVIVSHQMVETEEFHGVRQVSGKIDVQHYPLDLNATIAYRDVDDHAIEVDHQPLYVLGVVDLSATAIDITHAELLVRRRQLPHSVHIQHHDLTTSSAGVAGVHVDYHEIRLLLEPLSSVRHTVMGDHGIELFHQGLDAVHQVRLELDSHWILLDHARLLKTGQLSHEIDVIIGATGILSYDVDTLISGAIAVGMPTLWTTRDFVDIRAISADDFKIAEIVPSPVSGDVYGLDYDPVNKQFVIVDENGRIHFLDENWSLLSSGDSAPVDSSVCITHDEIVTRKGNDDLNRFTVSGEFIREHYHEWSLDTFAHDGVGPITDLFYYDGSAWAAIFGHWIGFSARHSLLRIEFSVNEFDEGIYYFTERIDLPWLRGDDGLTHDDYIEGATHDGSHFWLLGTRSTGSPCGNNSVPVYQVAENGTLLSMSCTVDTGNHEFFRLTAVRRMTLPAVFRKVQSVAVRERPVFEKLIGEDGPI